MCHPTGPPQAPPREAVWVTRAATDGKFARLQQRLRRFGGEHCSMAQEAGPEAGGQRSLSGCLHPSQPSCVYTAEMKTPQALGPQARTKPSCGRGDPCTPSTAHALDTITRGQPNCYTPRGPAPSPPLREPSVTPISRKRRARAEAAAT